MIEYLCPSPATLLRSQGLLCKRVRALELDLGSGIYVDDVSVYSGQRPNGLRCRLSVCCIVGGITWYVAKDLLTVFHYNVSVIDRLETAIYP